MVVASKAYQSPFLTVFNQYGLSEIIAYPSQFEILYPEVEKILSQLHKNYKIGLIANQSSGAKERLEGWGISEYFDVIVSSSEAGVAKPDEKIFKLALEKSEAIPQNAVMIGDRLDNDIFPAKKLGFQTIWIKQGLGGLQKPLSNAYQADFEISSISDILNIFNKK
ncbi:MULTISPECIES: HAD family hydrolase [unclassified Lactococcus]|uniref:HAD family hydrolase n=1 Tax=unclassified Lactococcus TaxID=2643510 RepID=UPI0011CB686E|nr:MULTISPECIES: HAD family hydrolase [unclassified Lactococcus]MQW23242.1 HAD-IA family hydrolase [Lactococcus sp. dk101]TXK38089.1 HAD family hydrolase [Lactococcus sp. dk310]TXK49768.1 HAD family hydrolase [Lactococcus sp. dk322]